VPAVHQSTSGNGARKVLAATPDGSMRDIISKAAAFPDIERMLRVDNADCLR
jgi:hypothetical protein